MSLAVASAGRKGKTINVFAGINSSPESIDKGKNEHLRSVFVKGTAKSTKITEEGRHPLFGNSAGDVYQRLLRIDGKLGAAASGAGTDPQIALFDAAGSTGKSLVRRGTIDLHKDAENLDVLQLADGSYLLAYCFKYELFLVRVGKEQTDPQLIYCIPVDEPNRPAFRCIRFLGPEFLLAVANMPGRSGVAIHGYRLPKAGQEKARLAVSAKISRKVAATALAVANLTSPTRASNGGVQSLGDTQFVIAVAGHESSITIFSLSHVQSSTINLLTKLNPLSTLKAVHGEDNITGLAFSTFITPSTKSALAEQQYLKLVSTTLQKTVSLHSIPLKKFVDTTPRSKNAPPPPPVRFVTVLEARAYPTGRIAITLMSVVALLLALIGQSLISYVRTGSINLDPGYLFSGSAQPSTTPVVAAPPPPIIHQQDTPAYGEADTGSILQDDLLAKIVGEAQASSETLALYAADHRAAAAGQDALNLKLKVHDEQVHGPGKTWEELPAAEKRAWKAKLRDAGAWTQQMGETVFKGVLFGEIGGAIGHAVAG